MQPPCPPLDYPRAIRSGCLAQCLTLVADLHHLAAAHVLQAVPLHHAQPPLLAPAVLGQVAGSDGIRGPDGEQEEDVMLAQLVPLRPAVGPQRAQVHRHLSCCVAL